MAKKQMTTYKRSGKEPLQLTEEQKNNIHAKDVTSSIIKYAIIAVVVLTLLFGMLSLVKVEVKNEQLESLAKGEDMFHNIMSYELISGWFEKSSFTYEENGIHVGHVYPHAFDYIVDSIPALRSVIASASGMVLDQVYGKDGITPAQYEMMDLAYMAMLSVEIVSLVWLVVMALLFALSFVKKCCPSQTLMNTAAIIHFCITFVMFALVLALTSNSQKNFLFDVGIGMWLNLLLAVVLLGFVIANMIYTANVKANSENA